MRNPRRFAYEPSRNKHLLGQLRDAGMSWGDLAALNSGAGLRV